MGGDSVDVIIAAWNSERTIGRAIRSALLQRQVAQVIVVDDASTDATETAAAGAADDGSGRLTVVRLAENGGPARARNVALGHSRSPCFCVLDADDYLLPDRMDRLLAAADGPWDLLADNIVIVPQPLDHWRYALAAPTPARSRPQSLTWRSFVWANLSRPGRPRAEMGFLKPIVRRAFLDRAPHPLRREPQTCRGLRPVRAGPHRRRPLSAGRRVRLCRHRAQRSRSARAIPATTCRRSPSSTPAASPLIPSCPPTHDPRWRRIGPHHVAQVPSSGGAGVPTGAGSASSACRAREICRRRCPISSPRPSGRSSTPGSARDARYALPQVRLLLDLALSEPALSMYDGRRGGTAA